MIEGVYSPVKWIEMELDTTRIAKRKTVGNTVYIAYQAKNEPRVYALVIEFHMRKEGIIGKIMDEDMGPYAYKCPHEILELLTRTTNRYALKWRAKNWENYDVYMDWNSLLSEDDRAIELYERYEDAMREHHDPDLIVSALDDDVMMSPDGKPLTVVATADDQTHWVTRASYKRVFAESGHKTHHTLLSLCEEIPRRAIILRNATKDR